MRYYLNIFFVKIEFHYSLIFVTFIKGQYFFIIYFLIILELKCDYIYITRT